MVLFRVIWRFRKILSSYVELTLIQKNFENKKQNEAISLLKTANEIFPEYFLALDRLGYEYLGQNKFADNDFKAVSFIIDTTPDLI